MAKYESPAILNTAYSKAKFSLNNELEIKTFENSETWRTPLKIALILVNVESIICKELY